MGKLYLIPSLISEINPLEVIPLGTKKVIENTKFYIAENAKSARAFLKKVVPYIQQSSIEVVQIDKHRSENDFFSYLDKCKEGENVGLLSEAGCPAVADPGSLLVMEAHRRNIEVVPLVGPSSLLLALMASGLNGQNYAFVGYLPVDKHERRRKIKELEARSLKDKTTFIFIETPYRNTKLIEDCLQTLRPDTLLCIASDLTGPKQYIKTLKISDWAKENFVTLEKVPAIFLIGVQP
ncbi:S-adenosylmethionine-dependent methyltransferase [Thermaurantimonas aggregans]|uniref:S-adenosylmethionine-dependent methyltransferase n=1 Tax=Thermaurantimonas aggregans TaxID=2173829 RepID=A0A401XK52_9FLAO|nr:SAM-dependent methyltransferase [Thermaurantimonas aggregans]MCX8148544.1 SAM-dependent methyltransferase [Thermaurantimonas aggregans]GCD77382.1 S-adenosylmethionine-dependent methyltransferase [Thermaurantimonas aggregans]